MKSHTISLSPRYVLLLFIPFCLILSISIFAHQRLNAQQSLDQVSISVSPRSLDIAINPGESIENIFRVTNGSDETIKIEPSPKNFLPRGNEGAIELLEDSTPFSLADWISVSPGGPVSVPAKKTVDFIVTISVPNNADPGGHFGSVVFRTLPAQQDQDGGGALISQEIAPVILVKVPGDVLEAASISSFKPLKSFISDETSSEFELIIKNDGNVHFRPTGQVTIKNTIGREVAKINIEGQNVIPGAERKMNVVWDDFGLRMGRYTAEATVVYGSDNNILNAKTSIIILPLKKIIPLALVIIVIGFIGYRSRNRIKLAIKILFGKTPQE
jgi:hypothetical protein